jgi:hypothetical protein
MGGKPSKGTSSDKRLKVNQPTTRKQTPAVVKDKSKGKA